MKVLLNDKNIFISELENKIYCFSYYDLIASYDKKTKVVHKIKNNLSITSEKHFEIFQKIVLTR